MVDLGLRLGPVSLAHPLINASGTMDIFAIAEATSAGILTAPPVAAYVPKTITLEPRSGNAPPRLVETPEGMVNAVGLPGEGLQVFIQAELPKLLSLPCPVIASVAGFSVAEYVALAGGLRRALDEATEAPWTERVGLEMNISCPNVHSGCTSIGSDPAETETVVSAVRELWPGLLVVKLTPNVTDISAVGRAAEAAGADAVAAVNTFKALVLDRRTLRPYLGNVTGGLSGPAIKPLALRAVYELFDRVDVPIIGIGGVATVQDVVDFMACGARVVAVGSAAFQDHLRVRDLAEGLAAELDARGLSVDELVGLAHKPI